MVQETLLNTPIIWINTYLQEKLAESLKPTPGSALDVGLAPQESPGIGIPFFPTKPSTIDELTQQWITINDNIYPYAGVMAVWDRMFRMRRSPFPHIKSEQVLYYFYGTDENASLKMIQISEAIMRLMDGSDETAQDINRWAEAKGQINVGTELSPILVTPNFYFHRFRVYHLEEARDIVDFGTARTYAANKIIIDYDYHIKRV